MQRAGTNGPVGVARPHAVRPDVTLSCRDAARLRPHAGHARAASPDARGTHGRCVSVCSCIPGVRTSVRSGPLGAQVKIVFLLYNAYGIGGTIRSTVNVSAALAPRHDVHIVSVHRTVDAPQLPVDPRVTLTSLIDWRPGSGDTCAEDPAAGRPSEMFTDEGVCSGRLAPSRLTDRRVAAFLRGTGADVVIATRPVLNGYLARYGTSRPLRIGQEHVLLQMHSDGLRAGQNAAIARLDAFVTVSESDAADYRAALPGVSTRILSIPNCSPSTPVTPSSGDSRTVVAAGRLIPVKRYDRLLDAFALVAERRPDWHLRLYGRGTLRAALREQIDRLGLYHHVRLMGPVAPIEPEWAKGAIAAVSSDRESFGMTIVEAMRCGVPVVATDCPYGPGEIITHGENGLLVPPAGGTEAFADALVTLIDDEEGRRAMAAAAQRRAADYAPEIIARRYERLIDELTAARRSRRLRRLLRAPAALVRSGLAPRGGPAPDGDPGRPEPLGPAARCAVLPDGSVRVVVAPDVPAGDSPAELLLRLRHDPARREVRAPLTPVDTGPHGSAAAVVDRTRQSLPEGRWDCYVVPRGRSKGRRRLRAELVEQAALLTLPPVVDERGVSAWVPYTTSDGFLAVRSWLRPAHAEVARVQLDDVSLTVTATLLGGPAPARWEEARVVATPRGGAGAPLTAPVETLGDGRFRCRLPLAGARARGGGEPEAYDLALLGAPDAAPVPLGRITGDGVQRKTTDVFPETVVAAASGTTLAARPYFTVHQMLALVVRPSAAPAATPSVPGPGRERTLQAGVRP
jgi:glycosyltransferase involved in cell wall biosynthesis